MAVPPPQQAVAAAAVRRWWLAAVVVPAAALATTALANVTGGAPATRSVPRPPAVGDGKTTEVVSPPAPVTARALAVVVWFVINKMVTIF